LEGVESALQVASGQELCQAGDEHEHHGTDEEKSKGRRGVRFHDLGNAIVEHSKRQEDADGPGDPGRHAPRGNIGIQQAHQEEGTKAVRHDGESLAVGVPRVKGFADRLDHGRADADYDEPEEELCGFEDDGLAAGEGPDAGELALQVAPAHQAVSLGSTAQGQQRKQVHQQNESPIASRLRNPLPGPNGP